MDEPESPETLRAELERLRKRVKGVDAVHSAELARIARRLHDGLAQELTGLGMLSELLRMKLEQAGRSETGEAARLTERIGAALAEIRDLARGLRPLELEPGGIAAALERFVSETAGRTRVAVSFLAPETFDEPDPLVAAQVFHVAREAVLNAVRRGRATRIEVRLEAGEGGFRLVAEDDGPEGGESPPEGLGAGLKLLEDRARMIDGELRIARRAGGGTRVTLAWPSGPRR